MPYLCRNSLSMLIAARQWAKRRGPALNHAHLHSLFRKHKIKLFIPATSQIKSVSEHSQLSEGSQLLIPKDAVLPDVRLQTRQNRPLPDLSTARALALAERLKQSVLYQDDDLLVVNKPAGLSVQGGPGIKLSLDQIMGPALGGSSSQQLKLVHRLDKDASGCLVIACNADSAAWLSQAFAQHAAAAANPNADYSGATVQREYLAVVQQSEQLSQEPGGVITDPLMGPGGTLQPATTLYKTVKCNDSIALLKLTPKTGRKHQLRIHCAKSLSAPILGDAKYGMTRGTVQRKVLADLKAMLQTNAPAVSSKASTDGVQVKESLVSGTGDDGLCLQKASVLPLQLHAETIRIQKPRQPAIIATAEYSFCMKALLQQMHRP